MSSTSIVGVGNRAGAGLHPMDAGQLSMARALENTTLLQFFLGVSILS